MKKAREKHFLIIFILYLLFLITSVLFSYEDSNWVLKITLLIISILGVFTLLAKIIVIRCKPKNKLFVRFSKTYDGIVNWRYNIFDKEKFPLKKKKPQRDKIILFILFVMVPMLFLTLLTSGSWQNQTEQTQTAFSSLGEHRYIKKGDINIETKINLNILKEISYLIGKKINLPLLDLCFSNNMTITGNETIDIKLKVDNEHEFNLSLGEEICNQLDTSKKSIEYAWEISYKSEPFRIEPFNMPSNYFGISPTSEEIKVNSKNFILVSTVMIISWWAILLLVIRVFLYLYKGLELKID